MKHIEITDELYIKLKELAKEVNTQDNRHTTNVFFQIEDIELVPAWDGRSDLEELYSSEHDCSFNHETDIEEIRDFCFEHTIKDETEAKLFFADFSNFDFYDYLKNEFDFEILHHEEKKVYKNAFLTAKECEHHLEVNSHHYSEKARSYGSCAWRNNDIEIIHELLKSI
jgi:hypothetical protein